MTIFPTTAESRYHCIYNVLLRKTCCWFVKIIDDIKRYCGLIEIIFNFFFFYFACVLYYIEISVISCMVSPAEKKTMHVVFIFVVKYLKCFMHNYFMVNNLTLYNLHY